MHIMRGCNTGGCNILEDAMCCVWLTGCLTVGIWPAVQLPADWGSCHSENCDSFLG